MQRWNLPQGWVISRHPAHAALVSEADFIVAQDTVVPRGPAGPAVRRYLLAGLIACGRCGRRLESCWSYGRPAYRCRHGYSSATVPDYARPKNTYVREDQVLPHLAALAILLAGDAGQGPGNRALAQLTGPACTAAMIDRLRAGGTVLTYDRTRRPCAPVTATRQRSSSPKTAGTGPLGGGPPRRKPRKRARRGRRLDTGDDKACP